MNTTHLDKISSEFSAEDNNMAILELESLTLDHVVDGQSNLDKTRSAILELSNGDINKLVELVNAAKADFRDVISWASLDRDKDKSS